MSGSVKRACGRDYIRPGGPEACLLPEVEPVLVSPILRNSMTEESPPRKPFIDPVVSEPIDALDATRAFGGLLGQVIIGGGSSGTAIDDSDYYGSYSYYDSPCQDGVDGACGPSL